MRREVKEYYFKFKKLDIDALRDVIDLNLERIRLIESKEKWGRLHSIRIWIKQHLSFN
jgi:hypothetical protein